ncbi:winged helix-turn-helix domain-containing protein [Roseomonas sp. HF4]|uniref:ATP-binding protein n=1 Tax=Roseomonas sp. HF4 TaxID=2562313 RepID=UPI0010BF99BA|nr:winged helix-turn-helix domain-containing protein [Roseomonas sp. HF4]
MSELVFAFGRFELHPVRRLLLEGDRPLRLGSRAFDILVALLERAGEVVGKDELIARVWPGISVEEANLRVHVAALRKVLGNGQGGLKLVTNVPGRGYAFVAEVTRRQASAAAPLPDAAPGRHHNLPSPLTWVVGRNEDVQTVKAQLERRRFVTVVGPGGIGKTTVALAAAEALAASYADGAVFVDLAPLANPAQVPGALAAVLGLAGRADETTAALAAYARSRQLLIVLDGCEHVIQGAATLAEALLKCGPGVGLLVTSRERLRAEGEWVLRLSPLALPPAEAELSAAEAMRYPAVQLFVERASASMGGFELRDADVPTVVEICRRLDGIALAIELASGRMDTFGPRELATLLDDRFRVLTRGRRTALPRHQTLRATLDWSHGVLPEAEQVVLRRLSIFNAGFTLSAAREVALSGVVEASLIEDHLAALVAKSLLAVEVGDTEVRYRLLDTTRAYAREKLAASNELGEFARRHAEHFRRLFERAEAEWEKSPTAEWLAVYARGLDDLRAALNWAFSSDGDVELGVALTIAAVPLWHQLSLVDDCLRWVERSLVAIDAAPSQEDRRSRRLKLYAAFGWPQMYATARVDRGAASWRTVLRLAEELGDADYQLRALWALWADRTNDGEFREALSIAGRFQKLAMATNTADPADKLVAERMTGATLHFLGDQAGARERIEHMLRRYVAPAHRSHLVRFQFDQRVTARITLARVLWLQGFADQALREVETTIADALELNHTLSLCNALAQAACPVALLAGDLAAAERFSAMLRRHTAEQALDVWRAYGECFDGELLVRRGDLQAGLQLFRPAVDELRRVGFVQHLTAFLATLARSLIEGRQADVARAVVDEALERCERAGERWSVAELLRIRGETLMAQRVPDAALAEQAFRESLRVARSQGALSWELRTATSLARLQRGQQRFHEARDQLAEVYARFVEGFGTPDLMDAGALLKKLDGATDN